MMAGLGLILGAFGMDTIMGNYRFSDGILALEDGLGLVPVIMGLFGISEVILNIEETVVRSPSEVRVPGYIPSTIISAAHHILWPIFP
jgi:putative tricarboxylic transport membrane protein